MNFAAAVRWAALVTSSAIATASIPSLRNLPAATAASRSARALTMTVTPCWPNCRAVSKPIPRLEPVTKATFLPFAMFVASDWIDINRPAGDSIISDQSEDYKNSRIDGLDSPECGIHSKQGDVSDQQECEMLLKKTRNPLCQS